jgi:hypothetical protein
VQGRCYRLQYRCISGLRTAMNWKINCAFKKGTYINPSSFMPDMCPAGYYCPTMKSKIQCPDGQRSPAGSFNSTLCCIPEYNCTYSCPEGYGNEALARLFLEDEHGALEIDYVAVVEFFYPLVHPNCDEFTELESSQTRFAMSLRLKVTFCVPANISRNVELPAVI